MLINSNLQMTFLVCEKYRKGTKFQITEVPGVTDVGLAKSYIVLIIIIFYNLNYV